MIDAVLRRYNIVNNQQNSSAKKRREEKNIVKHRQKYRQKAVKD